MAKHIIIAVTNDLVTDQRVHRIANTLDEQGYKITLVGLKLSYSIDVLRNYKIKRFRLLFNKGILFYINYNIRLFFFLLFKRFDAVLSNDLDTLLASFVVSKLRFKKLIYDSHEYFTEVPELVDRKFQKGVWEFIEKLLVPRIKSSYTVCDSIANEYNLKYNTHFKVVRNLPILKPYIEHEKTNVLIYQGSLNMGRGIELMIDTMKYLDNYSLWIAGAGDIEENLQERVYDLELGEKVRFLGRFAFNELHEITSKACLGLSFEEDLGKNYRYALPNKLFDYIQARIPVLISDLPEMRRIVSQYDIGDILHYREPEKVAKQILEIFNNRERLSMWQEHLEKAAIELCWEKEQGILNAIFKQALS
jgi:glycosyltransferase involved in cell wall biosynthesis